MENENLILTVYPRLHLSLLAMHTGEYRINGGIGFAIKDPSCKLSFVRSTQLELIDLRSRPMGRSEQQRLISILDAEQLRYGFEINFSVSIEGNMLTHSGFGSGTAITIACLEALHLINNHPVTQEELILASGRGGTSGVGIHTYFKGGCVFDLGRPIDNYQHMPSNQTQPTCLPLLLDQLAMPDWDIGICVPKSITTKSQAEEQEFFQRACPVSAKSVYEATYHTLFGLYAAIKESNKAAFSHALKVIQECTWKKLERNEYGKALVDIETSLYECGAQSVGMSSLGPSLFFLADDLIEVVAQMRELRPDCDLYITQPVNHGRIYGSTSDF